MRSRFTYPLVFLVPSALVASLAGAILAAFGGSVLWLFVYGDSTWPEQAGLWVMVGGSVAAGLLFAVLMGICYRVGLRRELQGGLSRQHAGLALAIAVLVPALVALRQCSL